MDDVAALLEQNRRFISACREGSWAMLKPILAPGFQYLDGASGDVWIMDRYIDDLEKHPAPALVIDQVSVHVDGNVATVSARSRQSPDHCNRYLDTYERRGDDWLCVHACVWPLQTAV
jgi:Domain of unknown function (DUF4440)